MSEPVIHDAQATVPTLLDRCAEDYAEGQTYRHTLAEDTGPALGPELLALAAARLEHDTP